MYETIHFVQKVTGKINPLLNNCYRVMKNLHRIRRGFRRRPGECDQDESTDYTYIYYMVFVYSVMDDTYAYGTRVFHLEMKCFNEVHSSIKLHHIYLRPRSFLLLYYYASVFLGHFSSLH